MRNPNLAPPPQTQTKSGFAEGSWPQIGLTAVVRPQRISVYASGRSSLLHRFWSQVQSRGTDCVQTMEIPAFGGGNEQVLCTAWHQVKDLGSAQTVSSAQFTPGLYLPFPQPKKIFVSLLSALFSPLSTAPINTITIHN